MKSKFCYFIITTLCFLGFTSCSDDDDTSIKFYDILNETNSISVTSVGEAFIEATNTATGPITIKSNNENIATAEQSISSRESIVLPLYWIADFTDDYTQMTKPQITKAKGGILITVDEKEFK